jgi:hypothetical protein
VILNFATLLIFTSLANAEPVSAGTDLTTRLSSLVQSTLSEKIAGTEIRIPSLKKLAAQKAITEFTEIKSLRLVEDRPSGTAVFEVIGLDQDQKEKSEMIQTPYEAWKKVPVANKRIYPNSRLKNEDFKISEVNVATGMAREYRGIMLPADSNFNQLQTKQTILENQFVVSTAVEKQPDLRKGDTVKLLLVSGDLTLTTQAVAEEPASVGDRIRVMTVKSKREIVGKVSEDHSVEVSL